MNNIYILYNILLLDKHKADTINQTFELLLLLLLEQYDNYHVCIYFYLHL